MSDSASADEIQSPIGLHWRIPRKRLRHLSQLYDDGAFDLESKQFYASPIPGVRYSLVMHRNDYKSDEPEKIWISLYLSLKYKMKVDAKYTIRFNSPKFVIDAKHSYKKTKNSTHWEADGRAFECPSLDDLLSSDGALIIHLDGVLTSKSYLNLNIDRLKIGSLVRMLYKRDDKDFTLVADGKEIQAHKLVLATRSVTFNDLFQRDAKEVRDGQLEILDFDYATVEAAVLFFYDLPSYLPVSLTMSLLKFADKYGIIDLKERCEVMLIKRVDTSNVVKVANLSIEVNSKKVREYSFEYLLKCLRKTYPVCDYASLDKAFALELLSKAFAFLSK